MSYKLIKFNGDWADEFNLYGFSIMTAVAWDEIERELTNADQSIEIEDVYFGTNEAMNWNCTADFLQDLEVISISEKEAEILKRLFGHCFGYTFIDEVLEKLNEENEDES